MSARTHALLPQSETGKINCVHLSPLRPVDTRYMPLCNVATPLWFEARPYLANTLNISEPWSGLDSIQQKLQSSRENSGQDDRNHQIRSDLLQEAIHCLEDIVNRTHCSIRLPTGSGAPRTALLAGYIRRLDIHVDRF